MKATQSIAAAIALAAISGTGGYFLGKNRPAPPDGTASVGTPYASRPANPETVAVAEHFMGSAELKAKLDAEKNPIARFKLAMQHMEAWVDKSPREALDWLASQQRSERRDDFIRIALNQYAESDAKGAADWALGHLNGAQLNNALIEIAENWANESGKEAASFFTALPVSSERDAALEGMFFTWASNEPAAALDFIKGNPNLDQLTPTALRAALAGWVKSEPEAAVTASLALAKSRNDADQFANTLANWGTMDLEASSAWLLANVPAGNERTLATKELASIYANQSPDAGIEWLGKLQAGAERDTAASALVATWSRNSPNEAAKWAAKQTAATLSPESGATIARNFLMKNPTEFEAWRAALPAGPLKEQASGVGVVSGDEEDE